MQMVKSSENRQISFADRRSQLLRVLLLKRKSENDKLEKVRDKLNLAGFVVGIALGVLLLCDLFIFPSDVRNDEIIQTDLISYKRYDKTTQIQTRSGAHWFINPTGYEMPGYLISYRKTWLFKISYDHYNLTKNQPIQRIFPARYVAAIYSFILLFITAQISLYKRKEKSKQSFHLMQFNLIVVAIGLVLLVF